ncbi:MAG TPA: hypothetical protein VEF34_20630 [Syntrophobacteraceae bacterium]|nr:hypothetical protein [Syntrophobacteraceae bacterium]
MRRMLLITGLSFLIISPCMPPLVPAGEVAGAEDRVSDRDE